MSVESDNRKGSYLCWIHMRGTRLPSILRKIIQELPRVLPKLPMIHNSATRLEQKQIVKLFEQDSRRLMDRTQHCLSHVSQFPQETHNVKRSQGVKARRRLVKKEK